MSRRACWLALVIGLAAGHGDAEATAGSARMPTAAPANVAPATPGAEADAKADAATPVEPQGYSAAALYNQGNAYARANKPGLAVLYYERARLIAPADADVDANLQRLRAAAKLPPDPENEIERLARFASPTLLAWIGLAGLMLAGTGLVLGRLRPAARWTRRGAWVVGLSLLALTLGNGVALWPLLHEGVVLTAETPVRVAPVPMGDPLFVLPEAETVTVTGTHDEFVLIRTRTGRTGWVARVNLAAVVP